MAAKIEHWARGSAKTPVPLPLLSKLEGMLNSLEFFPQSLDLSVVIHVNLGHQDIVNMALILREEEGVISISDDKTVRIWLKRENGSYWPSVCHIMPAPASAMDFDPASRRLFVGTELGGITEFSIAEDLNKITAVHNYDAHEMRVTGIIFSPELKILLSISKDKTLHHYDTEERRQTGHANLTAPLTSLQ